MQTTKKSWMFVGEQAGKTEDVIQRYISLFTKSSIINIEHYHSGEHGSENSVKIARFTINSTTFMAMDSHMGHSLYLTPSMALYVECDTTHEIREVCHALSEGGPELMPSDDLGFNEKFGWLNKKITSL